MGFFSRQEYWNGLPLPSPGNLPNSGIDPTSPPSPAWQADSLPLSHLGSPISLSILGVLCADGPGYSVYSLFKFHPDAPNSWGVPKPKGTLSIQVSYQTDSHLPQPIRACFKAHQGNSIHQEGCRKATECFLEKQHCGGTVYDGGYGDEASKDKWILY